MWEYTAKSYPFSYKWAHYCPLYAGSFLYERLIYARNPQMQYNFLECIAPHVLPAQSPMISCGMLCHMARQHDHVSSMHGAQPDGALLVSVSVPRRPYDSCPNHAQDIVIGIIAKLQAPAICVKFTDGRRSGPMSVLFPCGTCSHSHVPMVRLMISLVVPIPQVVTRWVGFDVI